MGSYNNFNPSLQDNDNDSLTFGAGLGKRLVAAYVADKPTGLAAKALVGKVERGKVYLDRLDREVTITGCTVKPPGTPVYQGTAGGYARDYSSDGAVYGYGAGPHTADLVAAKREPQHLFCVYNGKGERLSTSYRKEMAERDATYYSKTYPAHGPWSIAKFTESEVTPYTPEPPKPRWQELSDLVPTDFNPARDKLVVKSEATNTDYTVTGYSAARGCYQGVVGQGTDRLWFLDSGKWQIVEHTRGQR